MGCSCYLQIMELLERNDVDELYAVSLYADVCIENIRIRMLMEDAASAIQAETAAT